MRSKYLVSSKGVKYISPLINCFCCRYIDPAIVAALWYDLKKDTKMYQIALSREFRPRTHKNETAKW